jgi:predicted transposase/invertase (TIGR01784 family)
LPNDRYHNIFHLREDHTAITLSDDIEIHFLELAKLEHMSIPIQGGLINWLLFLKGTDKSNWEVLQMNEPKLKKAMDTLEYLSQDQEARIRYEQRQKFLHDEASSMEFFLEKGMQEGIQKGEHNKAIEMAKGLLAEGILVHIIAKTSGLSEAEITALKQENK